MSINQALNPWQLSAPVRLVSSANMPGTYFNGPTNNGVGATLTLPSGVLIVDSVNANLNDYVLLTAQTSGWQNGVYQVVVNGALGVSAVLQRRADFQSIEQIKLGDMITAYAGTVSAGSQWTVCEPFPLALGLPLAANALVFVKG